MQESTDPKNLPNKDSHLGEETEVDETPLHQRLDQDSYDDYDDDIDDDYDYDDDDRIEDEEYDCGTEEEDFPGY